MRRAPLFAALVAVLAVSACSKDPAKREDGAITKPGPISVFDLRIGDCLLPDKDATGEVEKLNAVPCSDPHTQEAFAPA